MKAYFRKLLCWIGWHEFVWKLEDGESIILDSPPPDHAKCKHCGTRYK